MSTKLIISGQVITAIIVLIPVIRGLVTKKDCEVCKRIVEADLKKGDKKFEEISAEQKSQGKSITKLDERSKNQETVLNKMDGKLDTLLTAQ